MAIRCLDRREHVLPTVGFIPVEDPESQEVLMLDLRAKGAQGIKQIMHDRLEEQNKLFRRYGIRVLDLPNDDSFIGDLIRFFRRRMQY
jgi:uncharacterized protein (DUF58 family)